MLIKVICKLIIGDLSNLVKKHKLNNLYLEEETVNSINLFQIWNIFFQVSEALKYVHSKKIIHRDIICQNIFMTKIGLVIRINFNKNRLN